MCVSFLLTQLVISMLDEYLFCSRATESLISQWSKHYLIRSIVCIAEDVSTRVEFVFCYSAMVSDA